MTDEALASVPPPPGRIGGTVALGAALAVDNSEGGISKTFFPQITLAFGVGDSGLGLLGAISMFARMLFGPIWAILADRFGRKRILFVVTGLWGVWTIATGFAPSWPVLLVLYSIGLIGTVASEPILNGLLGSLYRTHERGRAFGFVRAVSFGLTLVFTPLIGQLGGDPNGWRWAMMLMGGLSILSGVLILLFVHEPAQVPLDDRTALRADAGLFRWSDAVKLVKIPTLALMGPMLLFVTSLVLFTFMGQFWARDLGYGITQSSYLLTVFGVGTLISALGGGWLADRLERRFGPRARVVLFQAYALSFAIVSFAAFQLARVWDPDATPGTGQDVTNAPSVAYFVVLFLLGLIFSVGFSGCVLPMVSAVAPPQLSATAFAVLFSLIQGLITAVLSLVAGNMAEQTHDLQQTLLWFVTIPYALNALYWFVFYRTYPRDVALQAERARQIEAGTF